MRFATAIIKKRKNGFLLARAPNVCEIRSLVQRSAAEPATVLPGTAPPQHGLECGLQRWAGLYAVHTLDLRAGRKPLLLPLVTGIAK